MMKARPKRRLTPAEVARAHCRACRHEKRDEIDQALMKGEPTRTVAKRFGLSATGIQRHQRHHVPRPGRAVVAAASLEAVPSEEIVRTLTVLEHIQQLLGEARRLKALAEKRGDIRTAMVGLRELIRIVELFGRLTGELDPVRSEVNVVNVTVSPETAERIARTYLSRRQPAQLPQAKEAEVIDFEHEHVNVLA
jgi:hypothetical protein